MMNKTPSTQFGARYLLAPTPNQNGMISSRLETDKVAALYQAHKTAGQDCLVMTYNAENLIALQVPQSDVVDLGDKPIHTHEKAVLLTEEDAKEYRKNAEIFREAGLEKGYNNFWLTLSNLQKIVFPEK